MAPGNTGNTIIRYFDGAGTGDRCCQTADGTVWEIVDHLPPQQTADRQGAIINGEVME